MKFKSDIEVQAGLRDGSDDVGTAGQILSSTGSKTNWIDQSSINVPAKLVVIACKNTSGATITKGTPVYQTGTVGATDVIQVAKADASDEGKMSAIGLLQTDLANNAFGNVVITGELLNITTSPIDGVTPTTGDTIYVKSGGGLTLTKPTGLEFIQNVGLVGKVSGGNSGSITVSSIMRSNDVPTPLYIDHDNQRLGIGTPTPGSVLDVQGTQGQLFSVTDDLSGDIFAVADISGVPIMTVNSSGLVTLDGNLNLPDNKKILLGTGNDLQIYHDGSHSYISDTGAGALKILASQLEINNAGNSENIATFTQNGAVSLFYNNSKKFETQNGGAKVTGSLTTTATGGGTGILMHTNSGISISSNLMQFWTGQSSGYKFYANSTGNETNGLLHLDASGNAAFTGSISAGATIGNLTAGSLGQQMEKGDASNTTLRFDANRWRLYAGASAGEVFTVEETGNVGISNSGPDYKLEVNGTFGVSDLPFNTDSVSVLVADETIGAELSVFPSAFSGVGDFYSFTQYGTNTVSYTAGTTETVVTYVNNSAGAYQYLNTSYNLSSNLVIGNTYKVAITFKVNTGNITWQFHDGSTTTSLPTSSNTSFETIEYITTPTHATNSFIRSANMGAGQVVTISNVSVKQVTSASNQIQKRELGTGAFGPTPVGAYLPLTGGTLTGGLAGTSASFNSTLNVQGVTTLANVGYLGDGLGSVQYTLQSANNGYATIDFGDVADANIGRLSYSHVDDSFLIRTNNATALTLDSSQNANFTGKVGIGITTTPSARLEVSDNNTTKTAIHIDNTSTGGHRWDIASIGSGVSGRVGNLQIRNDSDSLNIVEITGAGDVGIGTEFPTEKLDVDGGIVATGVNYLNQSNQYNNSTSGITGFGNKSMDASISYYDTGKNLPTAVRGIVWTGKHYIATDYNAQTAKFYNSSFEAINNTYGSSISLPNDGNTDHPHGATWDGRYLYVIQYGGSGAKIVAYDLDNGTGTATIVFTQALQDTSSTYDVEYAEGHLYTASNGKVSQYKLEGKTITHVQTTADILDGLEAQAITYDGSYLWITQNGYNVYQVRLNCTLVGYFNTGVPPNNIGWAWNGQNIASVNHSTGDVYIINTASTRFDTEKFLVMGGDVGIGTGSPEVKLDVNGNIQSTNQTRAKGWYTSGSGLALETGVSSGNGYVLSYDRTAGSYASTIIESAGVQFVTSSAGKFYFTGGNVGIGTTLPGEKLEVDGNIKIKDTLLSNQENTDIDTGAEVVAQVSTSLYTAAFFDFVIKKGTNIRSGTVYACHDGTNVEFTETSTQDLGDTSDVILSVDKSGTNLRLIATVTSDDWIIKTLVKAI